MPVNQSLAAASARLEDWVRHQAMPLWQRLGVDPQRGGHYERLLADGTPDRGAEVRVRVLARQAFAFAAAYGRGWFPEGEATARRLLELMEQVASHPEGGYGHRLNSQFEMIDSRRDLYDHAFYILANAWGYRALGDQKALTRAEMLVRHIDQCYSADYGGWLEGDYPAEHRRQNPHMHLLEAFLSLYEATYDGRWLARAGEIFTLFESRFYDVNAQVLREFFKADWQLAEGVPGQLVEPGHMLEWVWLLRWYGRCSGRPVGRYADALYQKALTIGVTENNLVWDGVDDRGQLLQPTRRCWAVTELIKACLVQARAGDTEAEARAADAINALFDYYLRVPTPGAYIDQLGVNEEVLVDVAPASTLYHLVTVAMEAVDHCRTPG